MLSYRNQRRSFLRPGAALDPGAPISDAPSALFLGWVFPSALR